MPERKPRKRPSSSKKDSNPGADSVLENLLVMFQAVLNDSGLVVLAAESSRVLLADSADHRATLDLNNLFRVVAERPQEEWRQLIAEHLDRAGPAAIARVEAIVARGLNANAESLMPVLKPFGSVNEAGVWFDSLVQHDPVYGLARRLLEPNADSNSEIAQGSEKSAESESDPCLVLGIDLPETIVYVTQQMMSESRQTGSNWMERALCNLEQRTPSDWSEIIDEEGDVRWISVNDDYDASRTLILDRLLPGVAERGWFVAPVGRNNVYFMPANQHTTNHCILPIYRLIRTEFEETPHPLSDQLYWVYQARWYHYPIMMHGEQPVVTPPTEFCRVFGILDAIDEANTKKKVKDLTKEPRSKDSKRKS